jgi:hypothetical protein
MWHLLCTKWHWADFLRILRFPLPILIETNSSYPSSSVACTTGQSMVDLPSGHSLTPPQETTFMKDNFSVVARRSESCRSVDTAPFKSAVGYDVPVKLASDKRSWKRSLTHVPM